MRSYFFYLICLFSLTSSANSWSSPPFAPLTEVIKQKISSDRKLTDGQIKDLWEGDVLSQVSVKTEKEVQKLDLWVSGLHPQNCKKALRKISHYEGYPEFLTFIKKSEYEESTKRWRLTLDHALMPFPMYLDFKMERVTKEGSFPFTFEKGFLSGLVGQVKTQEVEKRCQLTLTSNWQGVKTKIPDIVFSTFVQTLSEMGLKHLIRSSML